MKQFKNLTQDKTLTDVSKEAATILINVFNEVRAAEDKHPDFAKSLPDALLIIGEELGEAQRAYLQYEYEGKNQEEIRKELIQTAATVMRLLLNFDEFVDEITELRLLTAFSKAAKELLKGEPGDTGAVGQKGDQGAPGVNYGAGTNYGAGNRKTCSRFFTDVKPCEAAKHLGDYQRKAYEVITNDFERVDIPGGFMIKPKISIATNEPHYPAPRAGKSRNVLDHIYTVGGNHLLVMTNKSIAIEVRSNRIKYTLNKFGITQQDVSDMIDWCKTYGCVGFKYEHHFNNGSDNHIFISKREGATRA